LLVRRYLIATVLVSSVVGPGCGILEAAPPEEIVGAVVIVDVIDVIDVIDMIDMIDAWLGEWGDRSRAARCPASDRSLMLWNKLGSTQQIYASEVGPDGQIVGDSIVFAGLKLGPQGSVEVWYRPDRQPGSVAHTLDILGYGVPEAATHTYLSVVFNHRQRRLEASAFDPDMSASARVQARVLELHAWTTNEPNHIAITWNGCVAEQSERLRVFINGVALANIELLGDPIFADWRPDAQLWLDGALGNIKVWNYPKTDFSDRFSP
jgi:hypothetical protein